MVNKDYQYYGLPLNDDINFDTDLVSRVILELERGKVTDIVGLSAEHLLFCHHVLSFVLSKILSGYLARSAKWPNGLYILPSVISFFY